MAHCKKCNRKIKGKRSEHQCDLAKLTDGRIVHASRIDNPQGDVRQEIEEGKVKVEERFLAKPLKSIGEKFKGAPTILGGTPNQ